MGYVPASLGEVRSEGWFHYKFRRLFFLPPLYLSLIQCSLLCLFLPFPYRRPFGRHVGSYKLLRPSYSVALIPSAVWFIFFRGIMYSALPALPLSLRVLFSPPFCRPVTSLAFPPLFLFFLSHSTFRSPFPPLAALRRPSLRARITMKFQLSRPYFPSPIN